jgi:hypothetical protein
VFEDLSELVIALAVDTFAKEVYPTRDLDAEKVL